MIALGNDHGGFKLKQEVIAYLDEQGLEYMDFGCFSDESVDYPVYVEKVCQAVLSQKCDRAVLICGTGIGVSMAANRHKGIRAALCHEVYSAKMTRLHNDANVLCMGGRVIGPGAAIEVLKVFLETEFIQEEKHAARIAMF